MKKIKTLLFSIVPLLLGIGIIYFVQIYIMILSAIFMSTIAPLITQTPYSFDNLWSLWSNTDFNAMMSVVFSVTSIVIFGIWYYKSCGGNYLPSVRRTFHPLQFLGIVFLVPGTQFFSSIIIAIVSVVFPSWLQAYEKLLENAGIGNEISIIMMIYSVCLAPISEEMIFRGVTMRIARRSFPFWVANLIQAVLFGIFHMNILQGIYAAVLGLFLGYVCEKGGSIYLAIVFHFLFNLWGTTSSKWLTVEDPFLSLLIIFGGTAVGLVAGLLCFRHGNSLVGRAVIKKQQTTETYQQL